MKKNFLKKVLAVGFSTILTAGLLPVSAAAGNIDLASADNVTKPSVINFMCDGTFQMEYGNGMEELKAKYKELTGITLEVNQPAHNEYVEKVNLSFTAGLVPDALILNTNLYSKYATFGALADITDLYENSTAKKNYLDQGYVDSLRLNGKLYALPQVAGNGTVTYVRGDWLEALDMDIPTNYSEFLEMLRAFRDNDLDGNGKDDTIAITSANLVNTEFPLDIYLREFYQTATPDFVVDKDGKYVDGMLQNEMTFALNRMRSAFEEGLIDKEILTNNTSTAREKYYLGNVGTFNYWAGNWNNTIQTSTSKNVPEANVIAIPAIKESYYIERPPVPIAITYKCSNVPGVFKYLLEFMVDEGEGQTLFTYGVEGFSYDLVDGKVVFKNQILRPTTKFSKSYMDGLLSITKFEDKVDRAEVIAESNAAYKQNLKYYSIFPSSTAYSNYITDLNTIRTTTVNKIVYGDVSITDGLNQYAAESKAYVDAILADFNKGK